MKGRRMLNFGKRECKICFNKFSKSQLISLCCCKSKYCKDCFIRHINQQINNFQTPHCPKGKVIEEDILLSLLTDQYKEKYQKIKKQKVLRQGNLLKCPKDCSEDAILVNFINDQGQTLFRCLVCDTLYCRQCRQIYHSGKCDILAKYILLTSLNIAMCEKCQRCVQKNTGCDHIICKCQNHFCYKCWQPFQSYSHKCKETQLQIKTLKIKQMEAEILQRNKNYAVQGKIYLTQSLPTQTNFVNQSLERLQRRETKNSHKQASIIKEDKKQNNSAIISIFEVSKYLSKKVYCQNYACCDTLLKRLVTILYLLFVFGPISIFLSAVILLSICAHLVFGILVICWFRMAKLIQSKFRAWKCFFYVIGTCSMAFVLLYPIVLGTLTANGNLWKDFKQICRFETPYTLQSQLQKQPGN